MYHRVYHRVYLWVYLWVYLRRRAVTSAQRASQPPYKEERKTLRREPLPLPEEREKPLRREPPAPLRKPESTTTNSETGINPEGKEASP